MKRGAVYLPSGQIVRVFECLDQDFDRQAGPGESVVEVDGDVLDTTHMIQAGKAVRLQPRPTQFHDFNYTSRQWTFNAVSAWADVRRRRDATLAASDWTQLPDVPIPTRDAWATYRQALRDITNQPDPLRIEWPTPPSK